MCASASSLRPRALFLLLALPGCWLPATAAASLSRVLCRADEKAEAGTPAMCPALRIQESRTGFEILPLAGVFRVGNPFAEPAPKTQRNAD